jgi:hypothetical protein
MHSAPPTAHVKTRVFRDCRFAENWRPERRTDSPPTISRTSPAAPGKRQKPAFTEENTYQKPVFPGLTVNLV